MNEQQLQAEEEDEQEQADVSDNEDLEDLGSPEDEINADHGVLGEEEGVKEEASPAL